MMLPKNSRNQIYYRINIDFTIKINFFKFLILTILLGEQYLISIQLDPLSVTNAPPSLKIISTEQIKYRADFSENVLGIILQNDLTTKTQSQHIDNIKEFVDKLSNGIGVIEGSDSKCRPVAVTVQGAIEEFLASQLSAHNTSSLKALILTPAPCTPLMKKGPTEGLTQEKFDEARQHTLDQREYTLRHLHQSGANIQVAYSQEKYSELQKNAQSQASVSIYEEEKVKDRIFDTPLKASVPSNLVGALYRFNGWIIVTQGIQARDANSNDGIWKIWMAPDDTPSEAFERAIAMEQFVESNK